MTNVEITNQAPKDLDIAMKEVRNAVDDWSGSLDSSETMDTISANQCCSHCCGCRCCSCGYARS